MAVSKAKSYEKAGLLGVATTLVTVGVSLIEKQLYAGLILVVLGVGCFLVREFRK